MLARQIDFDARDRCRHLRFKALLLP